MVLGTPTGFMVAARSGDGGENLPSLGRGCHSDILTLWARQETCMQQVPFGEAVGLVVKNGILLVEQFEIARGEGASLEAALLLAGDWRVRPILMTTFASLAGLAPLALGIGSGADLQRPLAIAVMGGLLAATAMTLLGLPALLALADRRRSA